MRRLAKYSSLALANVEFASVFVVCSSTEAADALEMAVVVVVDADDREVV